MAEIAIRKVRDLDEDSRRALEALLGRPLVEEEQVSVAALGARPSPAGQEREAAAERLAETLRGTSASARAIPNDELESLIDEAMNSVRPRRS